MIGAIRLPASAATSAALHAGLFGLYALLNPAAKKENLKVISNVDLMIQVKKAVALPVARPKGAPPADAWSLLKMALPTIPEIPKIEMPLPKLDVKLPETHKPLMKEPEKLEDRGRMKDAAPKLAALDMGRTRAAGAPLDQKIEMKTHSASSLASVPLLEEVGARKVRNLPAALALEERRQQAVALQAIQGAAPSPTRKLAAQEIAVLREATLAERGRLGDKMPTLLPQEPKLEEPQQAPAPQTIKPVIKPVAARAPEHQAEGLEAPKKKAVEIEGPLANRKVVYYEVPQFPSWAQAQGILEASVAIRFFVAPDGAVLPDMRVESTSGYGRLDRLAMDSLKKWRFAPIGSDERQWGVITFRFELE